MLKTFKLDDVVKYSSKRIDIDDITIDNFITTDNLLANKQGIKKAINLPPQEGNIPMYEEENILVSNIRPYLKKIWYADRKGGCSSDVLVLDVNKEFDTKFIYYALLRDDFFEHMMNGSKGTKMPRGDKNQILDFTIPKINKSEQQKIASTLSILDKKIQLNNQINQKLEAMAKTLYDYWFVQFDFPDANGKPYKSSAGKMVYSEELKREIPEGWEVKNISDLLPVITGKEDANFAVKDGAYPFFTCSDKVIACDTYAFDGKAILVAGNGNFDVKLYEGKFNAYQRTYVLITDDEKYYALLYFVVKDQISMLTNSSRGSIIKFITKGDLENIPLALPKQNQDKIFNQLNTIVEKIEKSREETQKLTQLRDWLLPMLMNGQVTVADAKEQIDELMVAEPSVGYGES